MSSLFSYDNPIMQFLTKVANCIYLNILWFICSVPIITIGASTTALYYVSLKMVKNQEGSISSAFFSSFKENFRQSTIIWLIMLTLGIIIGVDGYIFFHMSTESIFWTIGNALFIAAVMIYVTVLLYVFPLQSRFENRIIETFKNSLVLGIRFFFCTILLIVIHLGVAFVTIYLFTPLFILGMGLTSLLSSFLLNKVFILCEKKSAEEQNENP